jgi:hypothetical protein
VSSLNNCKKFRLHFTFSAYLPMGRRWAKCLPKNDFLSGMRPFAQVLIRSNHLTSEISIKLCTTSEDIASTVSLNHWVRLKCTNNIKPWLSVRVPGLRFLDTFNKYRLHNRITKYIYYIKTELEQKRKVGLAESQPTVNLSMTLDLGAAHPLIILLL